MNLPPPQAVLSLVGVVMGGQEDTGCTGSLFSGEGTPGPLGFKETPGCNGQSTYGIISWF